MLELRLKKEELLKGVSQTQSIAEKRSSMPILSNVLLEDSEGKLCITATDLEVTFSGKYEADVIHEGKVTVPARKFYEIVKNMADEEFSLKETENHNIIVTGQRSTYQLHGLTPEDFPPMPDYDSLNFIDLPAEALLDMIEKTVYSIAVEETRYNLAGVYLEKTALEEGFSLKMVSTDGHRLSLMERKLDGLEALELDKGVIISKKGVTEMRKLAEACETLKLGFSGNSAVVKGEDVVLVMRLLDGRFPDYNLVIPKGNDKRMTLGRKEFLESLRRVSIMSSDDFKGVKFDMTPKELMLTAVNPDLGQAKESVPMEYEEEIVSVGYNPRYYIDALSSMKSERVALEVKDANNPCLVTADDDPGFISVIMPMKI